MDVETECWSHQSGLGAEERACALPRFVTAHRTEHEHHDTQIHVHSTHHEKTGVIVARSTHVRGDVHALAHVQTHACHKNNHVICGSWSLFVVFSGCVHTCSCHSVAR